MTRMTPCQTSPYIPCWAVEEEQGEIDKGEKEEKVEENGEEAGNDNEKENREENGKYN